MMASIRKIFVFFLRTALIMVILWLAFMATQMLSQRLGWGFFHRFLGPPF
jgi:hypothetical protein